MRRALLVLTLVVVAGCTLLGETVDTDLGSVAVAAPVDARTGVVERVVDGDTLIAEVAGERERIRLLRIDTPELARDGDPAQCLGDAAAAALSDLLPAGTEIALTTDVEVRDRFGRLLAHVWVGDTWVNGAMLDAGYADLLTIPPNVAYDDEVQDAVARARASEVGLWDPTAC